MSDPDDSVASTTSTPRESPLTSRLLRGKFCLSGGVPGANSEMTRPLCGELVREIAIARRIDAIGTGADHRDAARRMAKPAAMRGRVDALARGR